MRRRTPQSQLGALLRRQFAHNVRDLRKQKRMTQRELAAAAGVGRTFVSQIERGLFSVTLETVAALATALGVSPTTLIGTAIAEPPSVANDPASYSTPARVRTLAGTHG